MDGLQAICERTRERTRDWGEMGGWRVWSSLRGSAREDERIREIREKLGVGGGLWLSLGECAREDERIREIREKLGVGGGLWLSLGGKCERG